MQEMASRKVPPRHVVDASSGVALVFPETLSLVLLSEKPTGSSVVLTLKATLEASAQDLEHFAVAREIRLTDIRFSMEAPSDKDLISFDFVQSDAKLDGSILMIVKDTAVPRIKTALGNDPAFLSPVYRGNSEEYQALVTVASARLDDNLVSDVNGIGAKQGLAQALLEFIKHISRAATNIDYSMALVNKALAESGTISLIGNPPNRRWNLQFPVPLPDLAIEEILPKVDRVTGTSKDIAVTWRE